MKIIIIGSGWYGLHIAYKYQNKHNITILEQNEDIFMGSSYHNQNRLHLGFHYPRSFSTRQLCLNGYKLFLQDYKDLVTDINNNYYLISNDSNIDADTYEHIYKYEGYDFDLIDNTIFTNVSNKIYKVQEKLINHEKSKTFFKNNLNNVKIIYNYTVAKIIENNNKLYINDELECDIVLNCTYGQFQINEYVDNAYIYEKTITHVYEKIKDFGADCVTIMDGNFPSLFIRNINNNTYSLTHVLYTPIRKAHTFNIVMQYNPTPNEIESNKLAMEKDIEYYIKDFKEYFVYKHHYFGYKIKKSTTSDDRTCDISRNNNIISVHGGKITGIYEFEKYLKDIL